MRTPIVFFSILMLANAAWLPVAADDGGGNFITLPFRTAAVVAGTPIAIGREFPHNVKLCLDEYKDDNISWKIMGATSTCFVAPVAAVVKGCLRGPKNAFKHPVFTKESFSLGDDQ